MTRASWPPQRGYYYAPGHPYYTGMAGILNAR